MKEGLVKLKNENDVFYISNEKIYRYRMHCPKCGKEAKPCICYQDLEDLLGDIDDGIADFCCSSKCALLIGEWDELGEAMQAAGLTDDIFCCPGIEDLTEEQAKKVLNILTEDDCDFDFLRGDACEY